MWMVFAIGFLGSSAVSADFTVRECIKFPSVAGHAWHLPPSSGWKDLGSLTFNNLATSDFVVTALVELSEGNTPGTEVEYQIMLDGNPHGWFVRRVPAKYPTSQTIRSAISNVAAGTHTLGVRARNLSTTNGARFGMFWITPLLVPGTEITKFDQKSADVTAGSSWVDLLQTTATVSTGKMVYVAAYLETSAGTPNHSVLYRILRGGVEIHRFEDSVPGVLRDGVHFAFIDKTPGSGSVTYKVQAQTVTGSSTLFRSRSLAIQSVPQVTVYEGTATNVSVPSDGTWYTLANSPWLSPSASSIGGWGSDGAGFAHVTYNGSFNNEALLQLDLQSLGLGWTFEVGVRFVHGSNTGKELEALPSDWEQLGLQASDQHRVTLKARGLCTTSQPMSFSKVHFQVMATPDDNAFVNPGTCANAPWACCSQHPSQCSVYTCQESGQLSLVSGAGLNCPF